MINDKDKAINKENTILAIPDDDEDNRLGTGEMAKKKGSDVDIPQQRAFLEIIGSGEKKKRIGLREDKVIIGRSANCDIQLPEKSISREHACIYFQNEEYFIEDLNSTNGVYIDGVKIVKAALRNMDLIEMGKVVMTFVEN